MGNASHTERQLARERRAVHLRVVGGLSYQAIADTLLPCPAHEPKGDRACSLCQPLYRNRGAAYKAVRRAIERDYPPVTEDERTRYISQQQARIEALLSRAMRDALDPGVTPAARARMMTAATNLMRREANLLGLDARLRTEVDDALDAQIHQWIEELTRAG